MGINLRRWLFLNKSWLHPGYSWGRNRFQQLRLRLGCKLFFQCSWAVACARLLKRQSKHCLSRVPPITYYVVYLWFGNVRRQLSPRPPPPSPRLQLWCYWYCRWTLTCPTMVDKHFLPTSLPYIENLTRKFPVVLFSCFAWEISFR